MKTYGYYEKQKQRWARVYSGLSPKVIPEYETDDFVHHEISFPYLDAYTWNGSTLVYNVNNEVEDLDSAAVFESVKGKVRASIKFGNRLIEDFSTENVLMGITQAGMTETVVNNMSEVLAAVSTGSLYLAIDKIDVLLLDTTKHDLVFITPDRLNKAKNEILAFLGG